MVTYKVTVVDHSLGSVEEETYFIAGSDFKNVVNLITEEQEIVKIEKCDVKLD